MFSYVNLDKPPYVQVICECGRQFIPEEMYSCLTCQKAVCKFCCTQEIHSCFCKNCLENFYGADTLVFKNRCSNCQECPLCKNNLTIVVCHTSKKLYFSCQFCFWDSKSIDLFEEKIEQLLQKCQQKLKQKLENQQACFKQIQQVNKDNQFELDSQNDVFSKFKRKSILLNQINLRGSNTDFTNVIWTINDFNAKEEEKIKNLQKHHSELKLQFIQQFKINENIIEQKPFNIEENSIFEDFYDTYYPDLVTALEHNSYNNYTIVEQRHSIPMLQQLQIDELFPRSQSLLSRRNKMCKDCKKYLIKPERSGTNTSLFKLKNLLNENFPKILIKSINTDKDPQREVVLNFYNKTLYNFTIKLTNLDQEVSDSQILSDTTILESSDIFIKSVDLSMDIKSSQQSTQKIVEDSKVSVPFLINIPQNISEFIPVKFGFMLQVALEISESEKSSLNVPIIINLGKRK